MTRSPPLRGIGLFRSVGVLVLAAALAVPAPAMAQPPGRPGPGRYQHDGGYRRDNSGAWIGGALLGLGLGAIIGGALAPPPPVYYAPPPAYYPPPPVYYPPPPPRYYAPPPVIYYGYGR